MTGFHVVSRLTEIRRRVHVRALSTSSCKKCASFINVRRTQVQVRLAMPARARVRLFCVFACRLTRPSRAYGRFVLHGQDLGAHLTHLAIKPTAAASERFCGEQGPYGECWQRRAQARRCLGVFSVMWGRCGVREAQRRKSPLASFLFRPGVFFSDRVMQFIYH